MPSEHAYKTLETTPSNSKQQNLQDAKRNKNDEFYTQISDIEKEMKYYRDFFNDKIVFCNCDDPTESNFWQYFSLNFDFLNLKKLIATHYDDKENTYKLEMFKINGENIVVRTDFEHNGDFRHPECLGLLQECDVVVTNPPFSLFREYIATLIKYEKKFIVIGNNNALTYKDIFKLIKEKQLWTGASLRTNASISFRVPNDLELSTKNLKVLEDGTRMASFGNINWFTNVDFTARHEDMILFRNYNEQDYAKFMNYDAINVDKIRDIPCDYTGVMGVPITFINKMNPDQFEIIGLGITGSCTFTSERKMEILTKGIPTGKFTTNAKGTLYRKYNPEKDKNFPAFKDAETGELYSSIYARILIRRITNEN